MARQSEIDITRLIYGMQASRLVQRHGRAQHMEAARLYAGDQWSEEAARETTIVNFVAMYVDVVLRQIIGRDPRVMISSQDLQNKPMLSVMQPWCNRELKRMDFANTMRRVAMDGLFSMGITRTALTTPAESAHLGWGQEAGVPRVMRVDRDDYVWDTHGRDWDDMDFQGHRYRVPLEMVKDSPLYHKSRKELTASTDERFNREGDERINVLGRGFYGNEEEVEDKIDLWDIWLPRRRQIVTLTDDALVGASSPSQGGKPVALRIQDWIGPDSGPYQVLPFSIVPGNATPKGPVQNLINMHLTLNAILRKLVWSGLNLKEVLVTPKGSDSDVKRIEDSVHGGILPLDRPKDIQSVTMNIPNNVLLQFFIQLKQLFSWMSGNLDLMGGLEPQGKTYHQEMILGRSAGGGIHELQERLMVYTNKVVKSLLWYFWHDPSLVMKANHSPKHLPDMARTRELHPWNAKKPGAMRRTADFESLDIEIDPYSFPLTTPQQRAQDLLEFLQQVAGPLMQVAQQQGQGLDFAKITEKFAQYRNNPDFVELFKPVEPPMGPPSGGMQAPAAGGNKQTTHVRENVPMRTQRGNDLNALNALGGIDGGGAQSNGQLNGAIK